MAWYNPVTVGLPQAFTTATAEFITRHLRAIQGNTDVFPVPDRVRRGMLTFATAAPDASATFALTVERESTLPSLTAYLPGQRVTWIAHETNTGPVTIRVEGGPVVALNDENGDALSAGDLQDGDFYEAVFDGGSFRRVVGQAVVNQNGQATGLSRQQIVDIVNAEIARSGQSGGARITDAALNVASPASESRTAGASRRAIAQALNDEENRVEPPRAATGLHSLLSASQGPYTAAQYVAGVVATGTRILVPTASQDAYVGLWKSGARPTFVGPNELSPLLGLFTVQPLTIQGVSGFQMYSTQRIRQAAINQAAPGWVVR